jgi:hypothetical protein
MKRIFYFVCILAVVYFMDPGTTFAGPDNAPNEILYAYKISWDPSHKIKMSNRYFNTNIFEEYRINNLNSSTLEEAFGYKSKAEHDAISNLMKQALEARNFTVYSDVKNFKAGDFMLTLHATAGSNESISLVFYVYKFTYNGSVISYKVIDDCMWEAAFQFDDKDFNTYREQIVAKIVEMYLTRLTTNDVVTDYMSF